MSVICKKHIGVSWYTDPQTKDVHITIPLDVLMVAARGSMILPFPAEDVPCIACEFVKLRKEKES